MIYDTIIVGAGPAGLTAAVYTGRNRTKTLLISTNLGGQTAVSGEVANYPGFKMISGTELSQLMLNQVKLQESVDVKIGPEYTLAGLSRNKDTYCTTTLKGEKFYGQTVIITTGKDPKKLNIPGEKEFEGRGVSFCATCDAPFFKEKTVVVVGGGYSATEAAYMLDKYATKIFVLMIGDKLNGEVVTLEKIKQSKKITMVPFAHTTKIINDGQKVSAIEYKNSKTGECAEIKIDGVFVEIGSVPNTKHFGNLVNLNQWNEIDIDKKNSTKMPGLFAAGDVTSVWGKQIVIAAGEGAKAAMAVGEYLSSHKGGIND